MQSNSYPNHNRNTKRASKGTGGKVFVFLSGIVVGAVIASLIVVNFYAGVFIQQPLLAKHPWNQVDLRHGHRKRGQQKQQLRNDKSSSPNIHDKIPNDIECNEIKDKENVNTNNIKTSSSPSLLPESSVVVRTNENSGLWCETEEPSFYELARETGTDKVKGLSYLPSCLEDDSKCTRPSCERETCRPWGHFYQTMYQQKLTKFLDPDESFQLLEIGYVRIVCLVEYNGMYAFLQLMAKFEPTHNSWNRIFSLPLFSHFRILNSRTESGFWVRHVQEVLPECSCC
jgi:hypothetical protein